MAVPFVALDQEPITLLHHWRGKMTRPIYLSAKSGTSQGRVSYFSLSR